MFELNEEVRTMCTTTGGRRNGRSLVRRHLSGRSGGEKWRADVGEGITRDKGGYAGSEEKELEIEDSENEWDEEMEDEVLEVSEEDDNEETIQPPMKGKKTGFCSSKEQKQ